MPSTTNARRKTAEPQSPAARRYVKNRLQYLRERHKRTGGLWLTLDEVGKIRGLSPTAVHRHESNNPEQQRQLSQADVQAYAQIYKVEPHELFDGITSDRPPKRDL